MVPVGWSGVWMALRSKGYHSSTPQRCEVNMKSRLKKSSKQKGGESTIKLAWHDLPKTETSLTYLIWWRLKKGVLYDGFLLKVMLEELEQPENIGRILKGSGFQETVKRSSGTGQTTKRKKSGSKK